MGSNDHTFKPNNSGFTLIELLIVLVISGIAVSMAIPSWHRMIQNKRIEERTSVWERTLRLARQEALTRGANVQICPSFDGEFCDNNMLWSEGMIIYQETNRISFRQPAEQLLFSNRFKNRVSVHYNRNSEITVSPRGRLSQSGSITFCDPNTKVNGKKLVLVHSGRIRRSELSADCTG